MTLVDSQISFPTILKPLPTFESVYQGVVATTFMAFPGGLDPESAKGTPGYASNLQGGIPVPYGSRLTIWLPYVPTGGTPPVYEYRFIFRLRNVEDFRLRRQPYHLPDQQYGVPDTSSGAPVDRFVVVAGSQILAYEQGEPTGLVNLDTERWSPMGGLLQGAAPLGAAGQGLILSQGVMDPATQPNYANQPLFNIFRCDAEGDELVILCRRRDVDTDRFWDFGGPDATFADLYGTGGGKHSPIPNLGIYVFTGVNP